MRCPLVSIFLNHKGTTMTILAKTEIEGQHPVILEEVRKGIYRVTYGAQVGTYNSAYAALAEHESCVVHALTCAGFL